MRFPKLHNCFFIGLLYFSTETSLLLCGTVKAIMMFLLARLVNQQILVLSSYPLQFAISCSSFLFMKLVERTPCSKKHVQFQFKKQHAHNFQACPQLASDLANALHPPPYFKFLRGFHFHTRARRSVVCTAVHYCVTTQRTTCNFRKLAGGGSHRKSPEVTGGS